MPLSRWAIVVVTVLCCPPELAPAQAIPNVGQLIDGKVVVKIQVTLADDAVPYAPLPRFGLRLFGGPSDSIVVRTDDSGVVQLDIAPGHYRLVSAEPYDWRGHRYRWSVPLDVRPGMSLVDLTPQNAVVAALVVAGVAGRAAVPTVPSSSVAVPGAVSYPTAVAPKDGTVGVLLSLLISGGGQFYAGKAGKGASFLIGSIAGSALLLSAASDCGYYDSCDDQSGKAAVGLFLALGSWVTSMVSAPQDVREWNRLHGFQPAAVRPYIGAGPGRTARVGVRLALP